MITNAPIVIDNQTLQAIQSLPPAWQHYAIGVVTILSLLMMVGRFAMQLLANPSVGSAVKAVFAGSAHANTSITAAKAPDVAMKAVLVLLVGSLSFGLVGCSTSQTSTAYKTETAIDASVVTAYNLWQVYLQENPKTPASTVAQVVAAFNKVKALELVAIDATTLASTNSLYATNATAAVSAIGPAVTDLTTLLATFNIKL
jgi:hypothetical protein